MKPCLTRQRRHGEGCTNGCCYSRRPSSVMLDSYDERDVGFTDGFIEASDERSRTTDGGRKLESLKAFRSARRR